MSAPDANLPAQRFARFLLSAPLGLKLYHALWAEFPDIGRDAVFGGIALAFSELATAHVAAELELDAVRRELERIEGRRAAA